MNLNSNFFYYYNRLKSRFLKEKGACYDSEFNISKLFEKVNINNNSLLFLHVGLKKIKQKTNKEYSILENEITNIIKKKYNPHSILVPTFTLSFIQTGIYSVNYSRSEVGIFSELFRKKANYRTQNAIHSVSIISKNISNYEKINYKNTFSSDGLYGYLVKDNSYIINISTSHFVATHLHYIEEMYKVPYKNRINNIYKGVIFDKYNNPIKWEQTHHAYNEKVQFNRKKIVNVLKKANVLKEFTYRGIKISVIKVCDLIEVLGKYLKKDKYFLVSF